MLILEGARYNQLVHLLFASEVMARNKHGSLPTQLWKPSDGAALEIERQCLALDLPMSASVARNMLYECRDQRKHHSALVQLTNIFMLEMKERVFFGPVPTYRKYYDNQKLFGDEVFDRFSSANDDIYEAGACLALERPTACVMHLMRVLEAGLTVLAADLGVTKQTDWGAYLRKIQEELDTRTKGQKARSGDEQFYAEAAANFDRMRRAWRNPTMHPDKSYSQERAEEVLLSVKSFMVHLSTKLRE